MKRNTTVFLCVILLLFCATAVAEEPQIKTFTSGDYTYALLDDGTVEGKLLIPDQDYGQCDVDSWKDIKKVEIKTVHMGCKNYKILSLIPKDKIKYHYNLLQKYSCFGPFAIPLYGILTPADEKEMTKLVKGKVK